MALQQQATDEQCIGTYHNGKLGSKLPKKVSGLYVSQTYRSSRRPSQIFIVVIKANNETHIEQWPTKPIPFIKNGQGYARNFSQCSPPSSCIWNLS